MGSGATLTLAVSPLSSLIYNGIMVPASELKQGLNEMKQGAQEGSYPECMQAKALFHSCNHLFNSRHVPDFFFFTKINMQRSISDYEAMETILRVGPPKHESWLSSDYICCLYPSCLYNLRSNAVASRVLALSDLFTIILAFDKHLTQRYDGDFSGRFRELLRSQGKSVL